jgi:catechol 2,3-dioxygenase-like lactoylglutathione lyase family enzyme
MAIKTPFTASFHHVSLSVADLDAEQRWYQQALDLHAVVEQFELSDPPVRTVVLRAPSGLRVRGRDRGLGKLIGHPSPLLNEGSDEGRARISRERKRHESR